MPESYSDLLFGPRTPRAAPLEQAQPIPQLPTEEAQSVLDRLGSTALHGLGWVGGSFGKALGGRAIRTALGLLTGTEGANARDLLSVIPFSDTLGITDPSQEVTGAQLLGGNADTPFLSPEGIGGLGIDIITDPASWIGGLGAKALGKGAQLASKSGATGIATTGAGRYGQTVGQLMANQAPDVAALFNTNLAKSGLSAAEAAGQRVGGHMTLGLPFPFGSFGPQVPVNLAPLGNAAQAVASRIPLASRAGNWIADTADPFIRGAKNLFNAPTRGTMDPHLQPAAQWSTEQISRRLPGELEPVADLVDWMQKKAGLQAGAKLTPDIEAATRTLGTTLVDAIEMTPSNVAAFAEKHPERAAQYAAALKSMDPDIVDKALQIRKIYDKHMLAEQAAGRAVMPIEDFINYAPRESSILQEFSPGSGAMASGVGIEGQAQREVTRGMLRSDANRLAMDPIARGDVNFGDLGRPLAPNESPMYIARNYLGYKDEGALAAFAGNRNPLGLTLEHELLRDSVTPLSKAERKQLIKWSESTDLSQADFEKWQKLDLRNKSESRLKALDGILEQSEKAAKWQRSLNKETVNKLGGAFVNNPIADLQNYVTKSVGKQVDAEAIQRAMIGMAGDTAKRLHEFDAAGVEALPGAVSSLLSANNQQALDAGMAQVAKKLTPPPTIPFSKAIQDLGLDPTTATAKIAELMGLSNVPAVPGGVSDAAQRILGMNISPEQLNTLMNFLKPATAPAGARPYLNLYDSALNLTKAGQTSWPQTNMRNTTSDFMQRWFHGGDLVSPIPAGSAVSAGQTVEGLANRLASANPMFANMTDDQAAQAVRKLMFTRGVENAQKFQALEATGIDPSVRVLQRELPFIGAKPPTMMESFRDALPRLSDFADPLGAESRLHPLNVRGVTPMEAGALPRQESFFAPVKASQAIGANLERTQRTATFINALEQGFSPAMAAERVNAAHWDFGNLTRFERDVMRRIVPYYSYMRQAIPGTLGELATNPGGRMAQTIRTVNEAAGPRPGFIPEAVSNTGVAIPIGEGEDGRRSYVTSLGLPFEDLANLTSLGNMAGSTTPFLRAPIEYAMGRSFFTNRDLPATYPTTQGPLANLLYSNSPIGRAMSIYGQIANPNRGWGETAVQTLLGPRITNIDQAQSRREAVRQAADDMLRGLPQTRVFDRLSVSPEMFQQLTPEQQRAYQLYMIANRPQAR